MHVIQLWSCHIIHALAPCNSQLNTKHVRCFCVRKNARTSLELLSPNFLLRLHSLVARKRMTLTSTAFVTHIWTILTSGCFAHIWILLRARAVDQEAVAWEHQGVHLDWIQALAAVSNPDNQ
jgi:hypothetical protein